MQTIHSDHLILLSPTAAPRNTITTRHIHIYITHSISRVFRNCLVVLICKQFVVRSLIWYQTHFQFTVSTCYFSLPLSPPLRSKPPPPIFSTQPTCSTYCLLQSAILHLLSIVACFFGSPPSSNLLACALYVLTSKCPPASHTKDRMPGWQRDFCLSASISGFSIHCQIIKT